MKLPCSNYSGQDIDNMHGVGYPRLKDQYNPQKIFSQDALFVILHAW